jgi:integrase
MTIEEARAKARGILNRVRAGLPAIEAKGETFDTVITDWRKRYVDGKKLRTGDKMLSLLDRRNPYVFAGNGGRHMSASGLYKAKFDAKLPPDMPNWRLHDLRRTARSLMSRAKVSRDDAERVMGHAIGGVEPIYDRYAYVDEKSDALAKLANLIDSIVNPREQVVVSIAKGKRR